MEEIVQEQPKTITKHTPISKIEKQLIFELNHPKSDPKFVEQANNLLHKKISEINFSELEKDYKLIKESHHQFLSIKNGLEFLTFDQNTCIRICSKTGKILDSKLIKIPINFDKITFIFKNKKEDTIIIYTETQDPYSKKQIDFWDQSDFDGSIMNQIIEFNLITGEAIEHNFLDKFRRGPFCFNCNGFESYIMLFSSISRENYTSYTTDNYNVFYKYYIKTKKLQPVCNLRIPFVGQYRLSPRIHYPTRKLYISYFIPNSDRLQIYDNKEANFVHFLFDLKYKIFLHKSSCVYHNNRVSQIVTEVGIQRMFYCDGRVAIDEFYGGLIIYDSFARVVKGVAFQQLKEEEEDSDEDELKMYKERMNEPLQFEGDIDVKQETRMTLEGYIKEIYKEFKELFSDESQDFKKIIKVFYRILESNISLDQDFRAKYLSLMKNRRIFFKAVFNSFKLENEWFYTFNEFKMVMFGIDDEEDTEQLYENTGDHIFNIFKATLNEELGQEITISEEEIMKNERRMAFLTLLEQRRNDQPIRYNEDIQENRPPFREEEHQKQNFKIIAVLKKPAFEMESNFKKIYGDSLYFYSHLDFKIFAALPIRNRTNIVYFNPNFIEKKKEMYGLDYLDCKYSKQYKIQLKNLTRMKTIKTFHFACNSKLKENFMKNQKFKISKDGDKILETKNCHYIVGGRRDNYYSGVSRFNIDKRSFERKIYNFHSADSYLTSGKLCTKNLLKYYGGYGREGGLKENIFRNVTISTSDNNYSLYYAYFEKNENEVKFFTSGKFYGETYLRILGVYDNNTHEFIHAFKINFDIKALFKFHFDGRKGYFYHGNISLDHLKRETNDGFDIFWSELIPGKKIQSPIFIDSFNHDPISSLPYNNIINFQDESKLCYICETRIQLRSIDLNNDTAMKVMEGSRPPVELILDGDLALLQIKKMHQGDNFTIWNEPLELENEGEFIQEQIYRIVNIQEKAVSNYGHVVQAIKEAEGYFEEDPTLKWAGFKDNLFYMWFTHGRYFYYCNMAPELVGGEFHLEKKVLKNLDFSESERYRLVHLQHSLLNSSVVYYTYGAFYVFFDENFVIERSLKNGDKIIKRDFISELESLETIFVEKSGSEFFREKIEKLMHLTSFNFSLLFEKIKLHEIVAKSCDAELIFDFINEFSRLFYGTGEFFKKMIDAAPQEGKGNFIAFYDYLSSSPYYD